MELYYIKIGLKQLGYEQIRINKRKVVYLNSITIMGSGTEDGEIMMRGVRNGNG